MKALTLRQPHATLHAILAKRLEMRNWRTDHRGPIAIHAGMSFSAAAKDLCFEEPFCSALHAAGIKRLSDLPLGAVLTISDLRAIYTVDQGMTLIDSGRLGPYGDRFARFDDYRYGFDLDLIERLGRPIPVRGDQGLWDLPRDVSALLMTRVATWQQFQRQTTAAQRSDT